MLAILGQADGFPLANISVDPITCLSKARELSVASIASAVVMAALSNVAGHHDSLLVFAQGRVVRIGAIEDRRETTWCLLGTCR